MAIMESNGRDLPLAPFLTFDLSPDHPLQLKSVQLAAGFDLEL
jgi:hypothetical protein